MQILICVYVKNLIFNLKKSKEKIRKLTFLIEDTLCYLICKRKGC